MKMMMGTMVFALLLALPVAAQRPGPGSPGGPGRGQGPGRGGAPSIEREVDIALEQGDSIRLSEEQVQQLEALRTGFREKNTELREHMWALREDAAGDRDAVRERMEEFRARAGDLREGLQERFNDIISQEKRDRLGEFMRRSRRPDGRGTQGRGFRRGDGGLEMRAYIQGLRDGLRAGARFQGRRGRPKFGPGR